MIIDDLACTSCGSHLSHTQEHLECTSCSTRFPLFDGIPIFGKSKEIEQWTHYHIDPENTRHVVSGSYISEQPSLNNAYYSRFIPDGAVTVLDVGGGDGNTTSEWAELNPATRVHVMDLSLHGLKKVLRRDLPNMIPVCAPADGRFPFKDNYFDVVSTVFMVEHLPPEALSRFYREAKRVLKPGGRLVVASDTRFYDTIIHPIERLIRNGKYIKSDPTHINLMTPIECERSISTEGFQIFDRRIHWIAGRHRVAKAFYRLLPQGLAEAAFSTMYVISARK